MAHSLLIQAEPLAPPPLLAPAPLHQPGQYHLLHIRKAGAEDLGQNPLGRLQLLAPGIYGGPCWPGPPPAPPGPSHESRGGLACQLLRDASPLAQPSSLNIIEAEHSVGELGHGFQVPVQYRGVQGDVPERPASGSGHRIYRYSCHRLEENVYHCTILATTSLHSLP